VEQSVLQRGRENFSWRPSELIVEEEQGMRDPLALLENARLKQLVADQALDNAILKEAAAYRGN
jgi:hypothetical protein